MSLYVIAYDKPGQRLLTIETLPDSKRAKADKRRMELEATHQARATEVEIVILEAPDRRSLLNTHGRYFETVGELAKRERSLPRKGRPKGC